MRRRFLKLLGLGVFLGGLSFGFLGLNQEIQAQGLGHHEGHTGAPYAATNQTMPSSEIYQKFYQETKALRQKIWETKEDLRILYLQQNPDWKTIAEKRALLAQLTTELQKKASEYGLSHPAMGMGRGMAKCKSSKAGPMMGMSGCRCGAH